MKTIEFLIAIFIVVLLPAFGFCQNLVPNPGFETWKREVKNWSGNHMSFNRSIADWFTPNEGSPDLFQQRHIGKFIFKRPKLDMTPYTPRTGKGMIGLKMYGCEDGAHCKEYVQVRLLEPMQKGAQYYVEFWVKGVENTICINNIGACMTVDTFPLVKTGFYGYDIQLNTEDIVFPNTDDIWKKVSGTFCAEKDYRYISIGNFHFDNETNAKIEDTSLSYAFYLIDDVLVEDANVYCDGSPKVEVESFMDVKNILFETNKSNLKSSSFSELDKLVSFLNQNVNLKVRIEGHTDNVGNLEDNKTLSSDRAFSVKDYLMTQGVEEGRLYASGFGAEIPIANNSTEEGRRINRRVAILLAQ